MVDVVMYFQPSLLKFLRVNYLKMHHIAHKLKQIYYLNEIKIYCTTLSEY